MQRRHSKRTPLADVIDVSCYRALSDVRPKIICAPLAADPYIQPASVQYRRSQNQRHFLTFADVGTQRNCRPCLETSSMQRRCYRARLSSYYTARVRLFFVRCLRASTENSEQKQAPFALGGVFLLDFRIAGGQPST